MDTRWQDQDQSYRDLKLSDGWIEHGAPGPVWPPVPIDFWTGQNALTSDYPLNRALEDDGSTPVESSPYPGPTLVAIDFFHDVPPAEVTTETGPVTPMEILQGILEGRHEDAGYLGSAGQGAFAP